MNDHQGREITTAEICRDLTPSLSGFVDENRQTLYDAILPVAFSKRDGSKIDVKRLAMWLNRYKGRPYKGFRVMKSPHVSHTNTVQWMMKSAVLLVLLVLIPVVFARKTFLRKIFPNNQKIALRYQQYQ